MKSTELGDVAKFEAALFSGGSITAINVKGENIIHKAAWHGRVNIFKNLLENDTNKGRFFQFEKKNKQRSKPLKSEFWSKILIVLKIIINNFFNWNTLCIGHIENMLNAKDHAGCTPIHNAVIRSQYDMVDALIDSGAQINVQDNIGN